MPPLLKRRTIARGSIAGLLAFATETSLVFLLTLYLQESLGFTAVAAGLILGVLGIGTVVGGLIAPRVIVRTSATAAIVAGFLVQAAATLALAAGLLVAVVLPRPRGTPDPCAESEAGEHVVPVNQWCPRQDSNLQPTD